jgi:hypothetical protein
METGYHFSSEGLKKSEDDDATGVCVPLFPPGYDISSTSSDQSGGDWCGMARSVCIVNYAAKFGHLRDLKKITGEKVTMQDKYDFCTGETSNAEGENCECLTEEWQNKMMSMCTAIGDCGNKNNYIGRPGREVDIIDIEPVD